MYVDAPLAVFLAVFSGRFWRFWRFWKLWMKALETLLPLGVSVLGSLVSWQERPRVLGFNFRTHSTLKLDWAAPQVPLYLSIQFRRQPTKVMFPKFNAGNHRWPHQSCSAT